MRTKARTIRPSSPTLKGDFILPVLKENKKKPKIEFKLTPEERNAKAEPHSKLIYDVMKRLGISRSTNSDYDDYFQQGYIALLEAVEGFDDTRGVKWVTYAYNHVYYRLIKFSCQNRIIRCPDWRAAKSEKYRNTLHVAYLSDHVRGDSSTGSQGDLTLEDRLECEQSQDDFNAIEDNDYLEWLRTKLQGVMDTCLDEKESYILTSIFYDGRTQADVAKDLGFNQSYVSRLCRGALAKARAMFEEEISALV